MIGNDIVDLALAAEESNWQRKGWLEKLFSRREQHGIHTSGTQTQMIWLLWSMKEAAYKIINRATHEVTFAPGKLQTYVSPLHSGSVRGLVMCQGNCYHTSSYLSAAYIHTVASAQNNLAGITVYIRIDNNTENLHHNSCLLKDEYGIPYLLHPDGSRKDVSKSHHGRYEAIVF